MGKRCLGSDLKSFNNLLLLDTSLQPPLQGQCQGNDDGDCSDDVLANKFFCEKSLPLFNSGPGAGGSGPQLLTWSPSARSSSSRRCTSTSPTSRMEATTVSVPGLDRADTLLTATSPQTCSGRRSHDFSRGPSILKCSQVHVQKCHL